MITAKEALQSYGFSQKEIDIYLATLELGSATANNIAIKAKINRSTTYDILRAFLDRGIASKTMIGTTAHFEVASPEKLIATLMETKNKLTEALDEFKLIEQSSISKPVVRVYQGKEGFKTILNDILNTNKPLTAISTSKVFNVMMFEFPHYISERKKRNMPIRVIQEESKDTLLLKKRDKQELRETKTIKDFNPSSIIWIYENHVAIIKLVAKELICISIEDKTIHDDYQEQFELLWNIAK